MKKWCTFYFGKAHLAAICSTVIQNKNLLVIFLFCFVWFWSRLQPVKKKNLKQSGYFELHCWFTFKGNGQSVKLWTSGPFFFTCLHRNSNISCHGLLCFLKNDTLETTANICAGSSCLTFIPTIIFLSVVVILAFCFVFFPTLLNASRFFMLLSPMYRIGLRCWLKATCRHVSNWPHDSTASVPNPVSTNGWR